ncbi:MAG: arginine deiminase [Bacteroidetes bacterium]|nr:MAG: arginine deiminase [Bacteroidota bacterium]
MSAIQLYSETGPLRGVILHPPGPEVENMTPKNAERALYSDILNLAVAGREYKQLEMVLQKLVPCFRITDLLSDILRSNEIREKIVKRACYNEKQPGLIDRLLGLNEKELARNLIRGVPLERSTLSSFLSSEYFSLNPLHNFFFTRDASIAIGDQVLISRMAKGVRDRESLLMQAIFNYHPKFRVKTNSPADLQLSRAELSIEGGDVLIASEDITLVGLGTRTTSRGIDYLVDHFAAKKKPHHILVQELPAKPESFIHLDMVFTLLDKDSCMVYEPLILKSNKYQTIQIDIDNGRVVSIKHVDNLLVALSALGMDLEPSFCGGQKDSMAQEREQWHSGANFFAIGPGKVLGYSRNVHTLENLNQHGYEIIRARDVSEQKIDPAHCEKYVLTIEGAELARGGGGIRCMTMPFYRNR